MLKKLFLISFSLIAVVFLIISVISWNIYLGMCAFVIAITLTRFLDKENITKKRRKIRGKAKEINE